MRITIIIIEDDGREAATGDVPPSRCATVGLDIPVERKERSDEPRDTSSAATRRPFATILPQLLAEMEEPKEVPHGPFLTQ